MKIEMKGIVSHVGEILTKKNNLKTRTVLIKKNFTDDFGQIKFSLYPMQIVGEDVDKIILQKNDAVDILAYLNCQEYEGKYFLSIRLKKASVLIPSPVK